MAWPEPAASGSCRGLPRMGARHFSEASLLARALLRSLSLPLTAHLESSPAFVAGERFATRSEGPGGSSGSMGGVRLLVFVGAAGTLLQTVCLASAVLSRETGVLSLAFAGAALSGLTLTALLLVFTRRTPPPPRLSPPCVPPPSGSTARSAVVPAQASDPPADVIPLDRVAHELNELMTVVIAQTELLHARRGAPQPEQLEAIVDAGRRSARLARQLVVLAQRRAPDPAALPRPPLNPGGPGVASTRRPRPNESQTDAPPGDESRRESVPLYSQRRLRAPGVSEVVLLVEDEALLLKTTRRMLEQQGYEVLFASDGPAALEIAERTERVGVLITDLSLPGMDGKELARRLRGIHPGVRVLYMSGFDAVTCGVSLAPEGLEGFLAKPFTVQELEERVSQLRAPAEPEDPSARQG